MFTPEMLPLFMEYLSKKDNELLNVFSDKEDLGLYPKEDGAGYSLMIVKAKEYYTDEQRDKLFAYWKAFIASPNAMN